MKGFLGKCKGFGIGCKNFVNNLFGNICGISIGGGFFGVALSIVITVILMLLAIAGIVICLLAIVNSLGVLALAITNLIGVLVLAAVCLVIMAVAFCFVFIYIIPVYLAIFLSQFSFFDGHFWIFVVLLCIIWTGILMATLPKLWRILKSKDNEEDECEEVDEVEEQAEADAVAFSKEKTEQSQVSAAVETSTSASAQSQTSVSASVSAEQKQEEQEPSSSEQPVTEIPSSMKEQDIPKASEDDALLKKVKYAITVSIYKNCCGRGLSRFFSDEVFLNYETTSLVRILYVYYETNGTYKDLATLLNLTYQIYVQVPDICNTVEQFVEALKVAGIREDGEQKPA